MHKIASFLFLALFLIAAQAPASSKNKKMKPDIKWSLKYLKEQGFKKSFIATLKKHYTSKSFEQVLRLNILGFLAPPSHMNLVSDQAVKKSAQFIVKNKKIFEETTETYQVPEEIISALLWIETRHGGITGKFHVPSVYMHLIQANRIKNQKALYKLARKSPYGKKISTQELKKQIKNRSEWRANWALEELKALEMIHSERPKNIRVLKGSFAGAFGIPQFIPSSYRAFSASASANRHPNLFKKADAIHSVAKYLSTHGWNSKDSTTHLKALMKYNNSQDYAESILELSEKIKKRMKKKKDRSLAQQKD